jgi:hypothetical protein
VVAGACGGDQLNYWMGRRWGPRLATSWVVRRLGIQHWDRGLDLVRARGGRDVIISRMLPRGAATLDTGRGRALEVWSSGPMTAGVTCCDQRHQERRDHQCWDGVGIGEPGRPGPASDPHGGSEHRPR